MKKRIFISVLFVVLILSGLTRVNITGDSGSLVLKNIQALAQSESGEFKCYIHKDHCLLTARTQAELTSLNKVLKSLGLGNATLNISVDVTDATCLYSTSPNGPLVRCGQDKRCADIWRF